MKDDEIDDAARKMKEASAASGSSSTPAGPSFPEAKRMTVAEERSLGTDAPERKSVPGWLQVGMAVVGCLVALLIIGSIVGSGDPTEGMTVRAAEEFVRQELRAPATANFSPRPAMSMQVTGDRYVVTGWVEAENAFGVPLRHDYSVTMHYDAEQDRWTDGQVEILDR